MSAPFSICALCMLHAKTRIALVPSALFVAFCLGFCVTEFHGEGTIEPTLRFGTDPKHAVAASIGRFHGFFEVLRGIHHAIIHLRDDNSLCDAGILEFSCFDAADHESVFEPQFIFLRIGERAQGGPH